MNSTTKVAERLQDKRVCHLSNIFHLIMLWETYQQACAYLHIQPSKATSDWSPPYCHLMSRQISMVFCWPIFASSDQQSKTRRWKQVNAVQKSKSRQFSVWKTILTILSNYPESWLIVVFRNCQQVYKAGHTVFGLLSCIWSVIAFMHVFYRCVNVLVDADVW